MLEFTDEELLRQRLADAEAEIEDLRVLLADALDSLAIALPKGS